MLLHFKTKFFQRKTFIFYYNLGKKNGSDSEKVRKLGQKCFFSAAQQLTFLIITSKQKKIQSRANSQIAGNSFAFPNFMSFFFKLIEI